MRVLLCGEVCGNLFCTIENQSIYLLQLKKELWIPDPQSTEPGFSQSTEEWRDIPRRGNEVRLVLPKRPGRQTSQGGGCKLVSREPAPPSQGFSGLTWAGDMERTSRMPWSAGRRGCQGQEFGTLDTDQYHSIDLNQYWGEVWGPLGWKPSEGRIWSEGDIFPLPVAPSRRWLGPSRV